MRSASPRVISLRLQLDRGLHRTLTTGPLRFPVGRHAHMPIEAAILLGGPCLLMAPRLEIGLAALWQILPPRTQRGHSTISRL